MEYKCYFHSHDGFVKEEVRFLERSQLSRLYILQYPLRDATELFNTENPDHVKVNRRSFHIVTTYTVGRTNYAIWEEV